MSHPGRCTEHQSATCGTCDIIMFKTEPQQRGGGVALTAPNCRSRAVFRSLQSRWVWHVLDDGDMVRWDDISVTPTKSTVSWFGRNSRGSKIQVVGAGWQETTFRASLPCHPGGSCWHQFVYRYADHVLHWRGSGSFGWGRGWAGFPCLVSQPVWARSSQERIQSVTCHLQCARPEKGKWMRC